MDLKKQLLSLSLADPTLSFLCRPRISRRPDSGLFPVGTGPLGADDLTSRRGTSLGRPVQLRGKRSLLRKAWRRMQRPKQWRRKQQREGAWLYGSMTSRSNVMYHRRDSPLCL